MRPVRMICNSSFSRSAVESGEGPATSAVMFTVGFVGNFITLVLLERRRRKNRNNIPLFQVLVTGLVITDLMGSCLINPMILTSYATNKTLMSMGENHMVCHTFAFLMAFFGLVTMFILFAMALERCLAIGLPYFYKRHITKRRGSVTLPVVYSFSIIFCSLPFMGIGKYVQYYPGTWCFIRMKYGHGKGDPDHGVAFALLYASLIVFIIISILICNSVVMVHLIRMHQRQKLHRILNRGLRVSVHISVAEEVDHLILLMLMTITFVICSAPFTVRAYKEIFAPDENCKADLEALRFFAFNSIVDPWVFTILRPSVLRVIRLILCCQISLKSKTSQTGMHTSNNEKTTVLTNL
ncbi:prostaglandin E2 receptor EP2 subtype-like [Protopterus annectens]|uniref:prostaglandin E2 receptor EP2 subtype-like n=1 Tax=Protopterus annectens TaxID=7888 RepID=UPI001CFBA658|nr:prostaglandin E2 receptor EP2 subtype-like [Protopterus annectens]